MTQEQDEMNVQALLKMTKALSILHERVTSLERKGLPENISISPTSPVTSPPSEEEMEKCPTCKGKGEYIKPFVGLKPCPDCFGKCHIVSAEKGSEGVEAIPSMGSATTLDGWRTLYFETAQKHYNLTKERDELRGRLAEYKKQDEERGCI